jgi:hypothetical protein
MASIIFVNERKTLDALPGTNLRELALQAGIPLYGTFQRIAHINLKIGPLNIFSASDMVEIDGKGVSNRSDEEAKALEGRLLVRYKTTPNLRIASQVTITGDVSVRTLVTREMDKKLTKERLGYLAVVISFAILILFMFTLVGLDLVKKM